MSDMPEPGRARRAWVLGLFTLVYALNFVDRQIVTILAPSLKADLGLVDAQVGLLFGTAFALFYALFGLPLARLADGWHRVRTLALGLALWSGMTALSGLAGSFAMLALARVGVGIGEASAAPAAMSILQDYFPPARRATALAIYSSGIYLGAGASLMIGGHIVAGWDAAWPQGAAGAPWGLHGWQAAYLAVGLPGLLLALVIVATVREPVRGARDGHPHPGSAHPFRDAARELGVLLPPFSLFTLYRQRAPRAALARNLFLLAGCVAGAALLTIATDALLSPARRAPIGTLAMFGGDVAITTNMVQWAAVALGGYASASWMGSLGRRDPVAAALTLRSPSFVALVLGGGVLSFGSYGLSAFLFLYGKTYVGLGAESGVTIGAIGAVSGGVGTTLGGVFGDRLRARHPAGRVHVAIAAVLLSAVATLVEFTSTTPGRFYAALALATLLLTMWLGPVFAACQDHVLPRLRGTATAIAFLGINLIGLGLGPYWVGLMSDAGGDLRLAMLSVLLLTPVTLALFVFAARRLPAAQATLVARARSAGEPISTAWTT